MEGRDQQAPPIGWQPPGHPSGPQDLVEVTTLGLPSLLRNCEPAVPWASRLQSPGRTSNTYRGHVFLHRYSFCSKDTVREDVLLTLTPC